MESEIESFDHKFNVELENHFSKLNEYEEWLHKSYKSININLS